MTKRMVVIADGCDLSLLAQALINAGVKPDNIHITRNCQTVALLRMGVTLDLPDGRLVVSSARTKTKFDEKYFRDLSHRVP